jgi:MoaA/NifB/PqqE/SkfB family radical SAM enzyme
MLGPLKDYLKIFRPKTFKKVISYLSNLAGQIFYLVKIGKFKEASNYLWVRLFSIEEGLGLLTPFYKINPNFAPYPKRIELEVTTKCRFRCPKCEHTYWKEKQEDMSFENFKKIVDQFPGLREVSSTGIGHGFENPDYPKMLAYLKSKSIIVQFFDPLFLQDEKMLRELVKNRVNLIWISFDGATAETYEKMQVGSKFEKVKENIRTLVRIKNEMHSKFPEINFQPIITKDNMNEMPKMVEVVNDLMQGTNQSLIQIQFIKLIPFKENKWLMPEITRGILNKTEETARKYKKIRVKFIKMFPDTAKPSLAQCVDWICPFITVDGTVYPCCALTECNIRSEVREHALGNVLQTDYKDIWYSGKFRKFIKDIHEGKGPWVCCGPRECPLYSCKLCK